MKKWICVLLVAVFLLLTGCDSQDYEQAQALYQAGDYAAAAKAFEALVDYEDSAQMVKACNYALALELFNGEDWSAAAAAFSALGGYEDSLQRVTACHYELAKELYEAGDLAGAEAAFSVLGVYADSAQWVNICRYEQGKVWLETEDYAAAREIFAGLGDYEDASQLLEQARWGMLKTFLIGQPPYTLSDGCQVGITAFDPNQLTLYAEQILDLGFYVVVDRCAISFTMGEAEGRYELQTQTQTQADGLTGRTSCSAGDSVILAELTADTRLPLVDFYYHGQDVYGNVTERAEPEITELVQARALLAVLLEHIPVLLEQSGSGYTLQELGFTGLE